MEAAPTTDVALVRRMLERQFPQWSDLALRPVDKGGWDNHSFRLGADMVVRLPRSGAYAGQVAREHRWLPWLAPRLPLPIPRPIAMGGPAPGFPWPWSVYSWIEGEPAQAQCISDLARFATELATFLAALRGADATQGPAPGPDNFFRGGPLAVYDAQVRRALDLLGETLDREGATRLWQEACATQWRAAPVWVHGDIGPGNLIASAGRLAGVIDFGAMAVGDPACDLAIAWTFFFGESRRRFLEGVRADAGTWARARGWALWKGLVVAAGIAETNAPEWRAPLRVVEDLLDPR